MPEWMLALLGLLLPILLPLIKELIGAEFFGPDSAEEGARRPVLRARLLARVRAHKDSVRP